LATLYFSFFSLSFPHSIAQIGNNELNKVLGGRWKLLSDPEKEPFMKLADNDKNRYNKVQWSVSILVHMLVIFLLFIFLSTGNIQEKKEII
jgi:hypothetical protein